MLKESKFLRILTKSICIIAFSLLFLLNNNCASFGQEIDESISAVDTYDLKSMMDDAQRNIQMLEQQLTRKQLRERALEAFGHFDLGNFYYQQGKLQEAISEWNIAILLGENTGLEDYFRQVRQKIKAIERQKALMKDEVRKNALLKEKLEEEMITERQAKATHKIQPQPQLTKAKKPGFVERQIQAQEKQDKASIEAGIARELERKKKESAKQTPVAKKIKESKEINDEEFKKQLESSINKSLQKKVVEPEEDRQKLEEERQIQQQAKLEKIKESKKEQQERILQKQLIELEKEQQRLKQEKEQQEQQANLEKAKKLKQEQQKRLLQEKSEKEKAERLERQKEQEAKKTTQKPTQILPKPEVKEARRIEQIEKEVEKELKTKTKIEAEQEKKQAQQKKEELKKKQQEEFEKKRLFEEQKTKEDLLKAQQEKKMLLKKQAKLLEDREKTRQRLGRVSKGYADLDQKDKDRLHLLVIDKLLDKIQQELNKYR